MKVHIFETDDWIALFIDGILMVDAHEISNIEWIKFGQRYPYFNTDDIIRHYLSSDDVEKIDNNFECDVDLILEKLGLN